MTDDAEPYELDDEEVGDDVLKTLPGVRAIRPDAHELIDLVAHDLVNFALRRLTAAGTVHLALSGGSTPKSLYQRLMVDPSYRHFPWEATHLWIVDDRCVPADDERFNFKMIKELIVDHCDIPESHVHPMPVMESGGDESYEQDLRQWLSDPRVGGRLDYVLLGMGSDAHTASLFPRTPALKETERWVVFNDGDTVAEPRPRMTMTYPLINSARRIGLLVTGDSKHAALQKVSLVSATGKGDVLNLPVTGIKPVYDDCELVWFLDHPAAVGIS